MRRARRWASVLLLIVSAAFASALEVPADAEVLVTDADSRIVGVGRVVAGLRFDLVLEEGFAGPAVVVWLTPDGGVRTTEAVVEDAAVWVEGVELTSLLPGTFDEVRVRVAEELGEAWPPADVQGPPDDAPASGPAAGRDPPDGADRPDPPDARDPPGALSATPEEFPPEGGPPAAGPPADGPPAAGPPEGGPPAAGPPDGGPPHADPPGPPQDAPGRRP